MLHAAQDQLWTAIGAAAGGAIGYAAASTVADKKQDEITKFVSESNTLIESKKKEFVALNEYQHTLTNTQNNTNVENLGKEVDTLKKI